MRRSPRGTARAQRPPSGPARAGPAPQGRPWGSSSGTNLPRMARPGPRFRGSGRAAPPRGGDRGGGRGWDPFVQRNLRAAAGVSGRCGGGAGAVAMAAGPWCWGPPAAPPLLPVLLLLLPVLPVLPRAAAEQGELGKAAAPPGAPAPPGSSPLPRRVPGAPSPPCPPCLGAWCGRIGPDFGCPRRVGLRVAVSGAVAPGLAGRVVRRMCRSCPGRDLPEERERTDGLSDRVSPGCPGPRDHRRHDSALAVP